MVQILRVTAVALICMSGFTAMAQQQPPYVLGEDYGKKILAADYDECKKALTKLEEAQPPDAGKIAEMKVKCDIKRYELFPVCKDEEKEARDAMKEFAKACNGAGFGRADECLEQVRKNETNCISLKASRRTRTSAANDSMSQVSRMLSDFRSDDKKSSGSSNACISMTQTAYLKQKSEHDKTIAQIEADLQKATQSLTDRKKTLTDQAAKIAERKTEAQRTFQKNSDQASEKAAQDAAQVLNQAQRFEADKAKAVVDMYEPKMKETQAYAEEKVALLPFRDIRSKCLLELYKRAQSEAPLTKISGGDYWTNATNAKKDREAGYWQCVETQQAQVRAIKRSHAQARQGYRDQTRMIEQRVAELEKAKQATQRQQAEAQQRVGQSSARLGELLSEQLKSLDAEAKALDTAQTKADEDHKKHKESLEARIEDLREEIRQLGAPPRGDKMLSDAAAAHDTLVGIYGSLKGQASCKTAFEKIERAAKASKIPLTVESRTRREASSDYDRPIRANEADDYEPTGRRDNEDERDI